MLDNSPGDIWIFTSYAGEDDLPASASANEEGFVTFLHRMLDVKLRDSGASRTKIWRDRTRVSSDTDYNTGTDDALKRAAIMLVVMSKRWVRSSYCVRELERFVEWRKNDGIKNVQSRLLIVGKASVERKKMPSTLRKHDIINFFSLSNGSSEVEFVVNGKVVDERFYDALDEVAYQLQRYAELIREEAQTTILD